MYPRVITIFPPSPLTSYYDKNLLVKLGSIVFCLHPLPQEFITFFAKKIGN